MTDETRLRFLSAIGRLIPADRAIEAHLFPALRQGGIESGVAVVAVQAARPVEPSLDVDGGDAPEADVAAPAAEDTLESAVVESGLADEAAFAVDELSPPAARDAPPSPLPADAERPHDGAVDDTVLASAGDIPTLLAPPPADVVPPLPTGGAPATRFTVYSARYRHVLKGPDRGRWEVAITEEADAPLLTVEAVVRGVQRRAGDADDPVRISGDELRAALGEAAAPPA